MFSASGRVVQPLKKGEVHCIAASHKDADLC